MKRSARKVCTICGQGGGCPSTPPSFTWWSQPPTSTNAISSPTPALMLVEIVRQALGDYVERHRGVVVAIRKARERQGGPE